MTKYSFDDHPEHKMKLGAWRDRWIANALNTAPMTDADREAMLIAVNGLYAAAELPPPQNIVFASGPVTGGVASAIAAGVWWLREHSDKHLELGLSGLTEDVLRRAIPVACAHVFDQPTLAENAALVAGKAVFGVAPLDTARNVVVRDTGLAAIDKAVSAATLAALNDAVNRATYEAVDTEIYDAITAAISVATYDAVFVALNNAVNSATFAATDDAVSATTNKATSRAVRNAIKAVDSGTVFAATYAATDDAVTRAIHSSVDAEVDAATYSVIDRATIEEVRSAVFKMTCAASFTSAAAIHAAVDAATRAAISAATKAEADMVSRVAGFLVLCSANWGRFRHGGNYWSGWVSHVSFFRHVAEIPLDYSRWAHAENSATYGGPRFMHSRFCIVADRPMSIYRDGANRPHKIDGPFCQWRDGVSLYRVRGIEVPSEWIEKRDEVDATLALTHPNIEQRRALCEILGWSKVLANLNPRTIDKDIDPEIGELIEVDLPDAGACRFLRVRCGTGREFVLAVPAEMQTARASNAWSYGLSPTQLKVEVRT